MVTAEQIKNCEFPRLKLILEEEKKGYTMNEPINEVTPVVALDGTKAVDTRTEAQVKAEAAAAKVEAANDIVAG